MEQHLVTYRCIDYLVVVDNGLSWRDCPFYRVSSDAGVVASGMGDYQSALAAIKKLNNQPLNRE